MNYNCLSINDKPFFDRYFSQRQYSLSSYAFENIFIWSNLYNIFWAKIKGILCIFFKDRVGCFLFLPPLGRKINPIVIEESFAFMDSVNRIRDVSRIENIESKDASFYERLGYRVKRGGCDYICKRNSLANLKGGAFKKKRSNAELFNKKYQFIYRPYSNKDQKDCLALYNKWRNERKRKNNDVIYQRLLDDNFSAFKLTLKYYHKLNFVGRVIRCHDEIKAVTIGYPLNKKSFVILFEVCDLNLRGIAQYIFREFCKELKYIDINIMDDSGLENLKRTKLSYRPYKIEDNFVVTR